MRIHPEYNPPPSLASAYLGAIGKGLAVGLVGVIAASVLGVGLSFGIRFTHAQVRAQNSNLSSTDLIAKISPSIVNINTQVLTAQGKGAEAGTGIILTADGEILTNNHVVNRSIMITVSIPNHFGTYSAEVMGVNPTSDVALIKIQNISHLPVAVLGDSSKVLVGNKVLALGNALGRGGAPSVSSGVVTALDKSITASDGYATEALTGMIQTDATIASGDSGGPVINSHGEVIGMITAGARLAGNSHITNIGYAVPSNTAISIVKEIRTGSPTPSIILGQVGYMGISVTNLKESDLAQLGLSVTSGVLVTQVNNDSPALKAGLSPNSVITAINGIAIDSVDTLSRVMHTHKPGDKISLKWANSLGEHTANLVLTSGPAI